MSTWLSSPITPPPLLLYQGDSPRDGKHFKKSTALQMPEIWMPLIFTPMGSPSDSSAWVSLNFAFQPPKRIPLLVPGWAPWTGCAETTHRFHSESLDEKLESREAEDRSARMQKALKAQSNFFSNLLKSLPPLKDIYWTGGPPVPRVLHGQIQLISIRGWLNGGCDPRRYRGPTVFTERTML